MADALVPVPATVLVSGLELAAELAAERRAFVEEESETTVNVIVTDQELLVVTLTRPGENQYRYAIINCVD